MLKTIIKKLSLFIVYAFIGIYLLFLICPLILNPFLSKYSEQISKFAEENSGLKIKIEKLIEFHINRKKGKNLV